MRTLSLALRNLLRNRRRSLTTLMAMVIGAVTILPRSEQLSAPAAWLDHSEHFGGRISKWAARVGTLRGRAPARGDGNHKRYGWHQPGGCQYGHARGINRARS